MSIFVIYFVSTLGSEVNAIDESLLPSSLPPLLPPSFPSYLPFTFPPSSSLQLVTFAWFPSLFFPFFLPPVSFPLSLVFSLLIILLPSHLPLFLPPPIPSVPHPFYPRSPSLPLFPPSSFPRNLHTLSVPILFFIQQAVHSILQLVMLDSKQRQCAFPG